MAGAVHRLRDRCRRLRVEAGDLDYRELVFAAKEDGLRSDVRALDHEGFGPAGALAPDGELHGLADRTLQHQGHRLQVEAGDLLAVDREDDVAERDAGLLRGKPGRDLGNLRALAVRDDGDADAAEAVAAGPAFAGFAGPRVAGVGVELAGDALEERRVDLLRARLAEPAGQLPPVVQELGDRRGPGLRVVRLRGLDVAGGRFAEADLHHVGLTLDIEIGLDALEALQSRHR